MPREQRDDLSEIWGEELLSLESENTSDHERQSVIGKPVGGAPNVEENDTIHEKMMELEPLLETSGERNLRSIEITHGNAHATVWHKRCGIRITQTSAWYGMWKKFGR